MDDDIKYELEGVTSPEFIAQLATVDELLTSMGYQGHQFELKQVIGLHYGIGDTDLLVSRITDVYTVAVWDFLLNLGISLYDSPLREMIPILETIATWEHYILGSVLYNIVNTADSDNEAFASVVNELTDWPVDRVLETLQSVDHGTIERIREYTRDAAMEEEVGEAVDVDDRRAVVKKLQTLLKVAPTLSSTVANPDGDEDDCYLVQRLSKLGFSFGTEYDVLLQAGLDELDHHPLRRVAWELLFLYLYSYPKTSGLTYQEALRSFTDNTLEVEDMLRNVREAVTLYPEILDNEES